MKKILLALLPLLASAAHAAEASSKACGQNEINKPACYEFRYQKPDYAYPWLNHVAREYTFNSYLEIELDALNEPLESLTKKVAEFLVDDSYSDDSNGHALWSDAVEHGNFVAVRNDIFSMTGHSKPINVRNYYVFTKQGEELSLEDVLRVDLEKDFFPILADAYADWRVKEQASKTLDEAKALIKNRFFAGEDAFPIPDYWTFGHNALSIIYQDNKLGAEAETVVLNIPPEKLVGVVDPAILAAAKTWPTPPPSADDWY